MSCSHCGDRPCLNVGDHFEYHVFYNIKVYIFRKLQIICSICKINILQVLSVSYQIACRL